MLDLRCEFDVPRFADLLDENIDSNIEDEKFNWF